MIVSHNGWSYNSANMTWLPIPNPQPGGAFSLMIGINNITVDAQAISGTYIGYLTLYYTCTDR
jgi:hypothetical protein